MKIVDLIKVSVERVPTYSSDFMEWRYRGPDSFQLIDYDCIVMRETFDTMQVPIQRVNWVFPGGSKERLIAIDPEVTEMLLIPEIQKEAFDVLVTKVRDEAKNAEADYKKQIKRLKKLKYEYESASIWRRFKYFLFGELDRRV